MHKDLTAIYAPWGFSVEPDYGEWDLTFRWSAGQDGTTVWMAVLTEIDGGMIYQTGRHSTNTFATYMFMEITGLIAHWTSPITVRQLTKIMEGGPYGN